jgi:hypothetical protein
MPVGAIVLGPPGLRMFCGWYCECVLGSEAWAEFGRVEMLRCRHRSSASI